MRPIIFIFLTSCQSFSWSGYDSTNSTSTKFYGIDSLDSSCRISVVEENNVLYEFVYKKGEEVTSEKVPLNKFKRLKDDTSTVKRLEYHSKSDATYMIELFGGDYLNPRSFEVHSSSTILSKCTILSEALRTASKPLTFLQGIYEGIDSTRFARSHFCRLSIDGQNPHFFIFSYYVNGDLITQKVEVNRFVPLADHAELKFTDHSKEFSIIYDHDLTFTPKSFQIKTESQHSSPNCSNLKLVASK
jgi:hypothetical protein